ncbi:hypothetical protein L7F22_002094 [Adiantum nelumboides]|nr:hypothetical protein [Adiantum nelumboides]
MAYYREHFLMLTEDRFIQRPRYMDTYLPDGMRVAIGQLRVSSHQLEIESGRAARIPREARICRLCRQEVECESHFLCRCPHYMEIRSRYPTLFDKPEASLQTVMTSLDQRLLGRLLMEMYQHRERALQAGESGGVDRQTHLTDYFQARDGVLPVLNNVAVAPGIPVKPMLAKITNGIAEAFKRFQGKPFTCEYKYDGQRAQVHLLKDGSIRIFSRNCEDTTSHFPDVLDIVRMAVRPGIQDLIFDAEIVAVDRVNNNKLMAFQHLSTRERGRSGVAVSLESIKVDVCLFVFDLMYANGKPLVKATFGERRKRMQECFEDGQAGCFGFANQITIEEKDADAENSAVVTQVESFLEEAINSSCEGIMVKALDSESAYAPSKRSDSWLKVKRDYIEGLHDTLDLVPVGA